MAIYGVLLTKQVSNGIISFGKTYEKYEKLIEMRKKNENCDND